jgi:hypothetical protein
MPFTNMLVCFAKLERHLRPPNRMPHGARVEHPPLDGERAFNVFRPGSDPEAYAWSPSVVERPPEKLLLPHTCGTPHICRP